MSYVRANYSFGFVEIYGEYVPKVANFDAYFRVDAVYANGSDFNLANIAEVFFWADKYALNKIERELYNA
jgi:hypothetical protein